MPTPGTEATSHSAPDASGKETSAKLMVRCLENEGVEYIFGVPGEENIDVMDALLSSSIKFVTTHHEQGAAFMADVYGRLTGRAGVCMSTLGPGATNLITGVADANMDRAPIVAIAGQGATTRLHKESHQILDLVQLFHPITQVRDADPRAADRAGDRAQGLQGRADGEAGRHLHRLSREHRGNAGATASRSRCRPRTRPPRPTSRSTRPRKIISEGARTRSSSPATA